MVQELKKAQKHMKAPVAPGRSRGGGKPEGVPGKIKGRSIDDQKMIERSKAALRRD
ncbi:MAG: hypothetical protein Q3X95_01945 [Duodenibacillus sp.]|nr:hypothetical protein [Duodenibacillus sp.]